MAEEARGARYGRAEEEQGERGGTRSERDEPVSRRGDENRDQRRQQNR